MVSFKIPTSFRKGQDISFEITGAESAGDTFKITDPSGDQVDILGSFTKDNEFGETLTGTIEDAKKGVYNLVAYGRDWSQPDFPIYDKEIATFQSNQAQVLPSQEPTNPGTGGSGGSNSGSSGGNNKNLVSKLSNNKVLVAGAVAVGLVVIGEY